MIRHAAAYGGGIDVARPVLRAAVHAGRVTQAEISSLLVLTCQSGRSNVIEWLVEAGAVDVHEATFPVLIREGDGKVLDKGAPLHLAALLDNTSIITYLLTKADTDPDIRSHVEAKTPLMLACEEGKLAAAQALVQGGADIRAVDKRGRTALFFAATNVQKEAVSYLLGMGGPGYVNIRGADGVTAVSAAASEGHLSTVQVLVDAGADLSIPDKRCLMTPLHVAALLGHGGVVAYLLGKRGVDVEAQAAKGCRPLQCACARRSLDAAAARVLVEQGGADPHAKSLTGVTPLMDAASVGSMELVRWLVEVVGVDPSVKDVKGRRAMNYASKEGHREVVDHLRSWKGREVSRKKRARYLAGWMMMMTGWWWWWVLVDDVAVAAAGSGGSG